MEETTVGKNGKAFCIRVFSVKKKNLGMYGLIIVQVLSVHARLNHRAATVQPVRGGPRDVGVFLPAI